MSNIDFDYITYLNRLSIISSGKIFGKIKSKLNLFSKNKILHKWKLL